jgi:hypothetical protein
VWVRKGLGMVELPDDDIHSVCSQVLLPSVVPCLGFRA